jgi:hypothetical protein
MFLFVLDAPRCSEPPCSCSLDAITAKIKVSSAAHCALHWSAGEIIEAENELSKRSAIAEIIEAEIELSQRSALRQHSLPACAEIIACRDRGESALGTAPALLQASLSRLL